MYGADRYGPDEALSFEQRQVLAVLAEAPTNEPTGATFVTRTELANPSSVKRALRVLEEDELVARRDGLVVVADPFLGAWLRG